MDCHVNRSTILRALTNHRPVPPCLLLTAHCSLLTAYC